MRSEWIKKNAHEFRGWVLPAVIVLAGAIVAALFIILKRPPEKSDTFALAPQVKTEKVFKQDVQMTITGYGTVEPKVEVDIVPQVSGQVVWINPQFQEGDFVEAGVRLFQIDPRDFELSVQQAEATVAEAQVKLDLEKAEAAVAVTEWQQLHPGSEPDSPLVFRKPQIRQATAQLAGAEAALAKARLDLERTNIKLPVRVCISSKAVDLGQFVTAGKTAGSAYGVGVMEIELPLEDKDLKWFDVSGASADIRADFAGAELLWNGVVKRTTGQVDELSRMVSVVVEVANHSENAEENHSLVPGMFVRVDIKGSVLPGVVAVGRDSLRSGSDVWIVNDGTLHIRNLDIARADENYAYVISGLEDGSEIVVSTLGNVVDGMKVRVLK